MFSWQCSSIHDVKLGHVHCEITSHLKLSGIQALSDRFVINIYEGFLVVCNSALALDQDLPLLKLYSIQEDSGVSVL